MGKGLRISINVADDTELRAEMRRLLGEEAKSIARDAQAEMRRVLDEEITKVQKTIKLHLEVALQKVSWHEIADRGMREHMRVATSALDTQESCDCVVAMAAERLAFGARSDIERKMRAEMRSISKEIIANLTKNVAEE